MLEFKTKTAFDRKLLLKNKHASFGFNLIKIGLAVIFSIMLLSCKISNRELKKHPTNSAIEKISKLTKKNILVCAHRSFHKNAPENSVQSIKDAITAKIDIVEIDIRTTKDSVLVLMHDKDIDRVTTGKGLIKDYTFNELQQFNLKIGDSVTNEKIPLLYDALKLVKGKIIPNLDLKDVNYKQLYTMLSELQMEHEVISFIGKKNKIEEMILIDSFYAVMPLVKNKEEMIYYHQNTNSPLQHFTDESFTQENMKWTQEKRALVFVNALWDEDDDFILGKTASMDSIIALKPAIIQTDHPKMLRKYLKSKKLHQ